jgi:hypothetical protein
VAGKSKGLGVGARMMEWGKGKEVRTVGAGVG